MGRHQSTISREVERNGENARSWAVGAQRRAVEIRRHPKIFKIGTGRRLHDAVAGGLEEDCSPQQVSARLRKDFPDDPEIRVSHETIYQTLFVPARGKLRTGLKAALRPGRVERRPRGSTRPRQARLASIVNITERPAEAADRAMPGHWEGGIIIGKDGNRQDRQTLDWDTPPKGSIVCYCRSRPDALIPRDCPRHSSQNQHRLADGFI